MARALIVAAFVSSWLVPGGHAQTVGQRGFVEGGGLLFPQTTVNDDAHVVGDLLVRDEVFVKPSRWIQFAGGLDLRANTHDQVDSPWRPDLGDRGALAPACRSAALAPPSRADR